MKIQVFDPPMCCSSGVCGPAVDPELVRAAADIEWLQRQGVNIERYNLAQQPAAFVSSQIVKDTLTKEGNDCLPLTLVDGAVVYMGSYPSRETLAAYAGIKQSQGNAAASSCGGCCSSAADEITATKGKKHGGCGCG